MKDKNVAFDNSFRKITIKELIRFLIFSAFFFAIIFESLEIPLSFDQNIQVHKLIHNKNEEIYKINYGNKLNERLNLTLNSMINLAKTAIIIDFAKNEIMFNIETPLKVISDIRILQKRVKLVNVSQSYQFSWSEPIVDDKTSYGINSSYVYSEEKKGFQLFLPSLNTIIPMSPEQVERISRSLMETIFLKNKFFDKQTYNVEIDFGFANPNAGVIGYYNKKFKLFPNGEYEEKTFIKSFNFIMVQDTLTTFQIVIRIFYVILAFYFFISALLQIYYSIKDVKYDADNNIKLKRALYVRIMNKIAIDLKRIFIGCKKYFSNPYDLLNFLNLLLNIFTIIYYINFTFNNALKLQYDKFLSLYETDKGKLDMHDRYMNPNLENSEIIKIYYSLNDIFSAILENYDFFKKTNAFICILIFFRLFTISLSFSKKFRVFFVISMNIFKDLLSFFILFFFIFLNFAYLQRNFFCFNIPDYTNMYTVAVYTFSNFLGASNHLNDFYSYSAVFTLAFQLLFNFVMIFCIQNLFIVIVKNKYYMMRDELSKKEIDHGYRMENKYGVEIHPIYKLKIKILVLYETFLEKFNRDKLTLILNEREEYELKIKHDLEIYKTYNYDQSFSDVLELSRVFKDKDIDENIEIYQQSFRLKKVKAIWSAIFIGLGFFLFTFITTTILSNSKNFVITESINKLIATEKYILPNMEFNSLKEVSNINELIYFFSNQFQLKFNQKKYTDPNTLNQTSNFDIFNKYFLVQNKVRVTIRRKKILEKFFYDKKALFKNMTANSFLTTSDYNPDFEENAPFQLNGKMIEYNFEESFDAHGGYVFYVSPKGENNISDLFKTLFQEKFFGYATNSILVDFLFVDLKNDVKFVWVMLNFKIKENGNVETKLIYEPFNHLSLTNKQDLTLLSFLVLIILCYLYIFIIYLTHIYRRNLAYNSWYQIYIKNHLGASLVYVRELKKPEFLRKLTYLFDFKNIILFFILIFLGCFLGIFMHRQYMVIKIQNESKIFEKPINELIQENIFDFISPEFNNLGGFLNKVSTVTRLYETMVGTVAITNLFLTFMILKKLEFIENLQTILNAFLHSISELSFIILIFISILFIFGFATYLVLGEFVLGFSTFSRSVEKLLEVLFNFQYLNFLTQDRYVFEFLTLFLTYFIFEKFFFLNMFFAIIYFSFDECKKQAAKFKIKGSEISLSIKQFFMISIDIICGRSYLNHKHQPIEELFKTQNENIFETMGQTIRVAANNTNINIWSSVCAEEITKEQYERNSLIDKCEEINLKYFLEKAGSSKVYKDLNKNPFRKSLEYEIRKRFWQHSFVGLRYLYKYEAFLDEKIKALNEELKEEGEKNNTKLKDDLIVIEYIKDLKIQLEQNFKNIEILEDEIKKKTLNNAIEEDILPKLNMNPEFRKLLDDE